MTTPGILTLTDADFEGQSKTHPRLLVDFWADWCGPCKAMAPILEELAGEYQNRLTIGKVNVDENRQVTARFGIRSIPTLLLLRDGLRVEQIVGLQSKAAIKAKVDQFLGAQ